MSKKTNLNELLSACKQATQNTQQDQQKIDKGETVWIGGTAAISAPGTIALQAGDQVTIVNEKDVLDVLKMEGIFLVNVKVGTSLLHRIETISQVQPFGSCSCHEKEQPGDSTVPAPATTARIWDRIKRIFKKCRTVQECEWVRDPATGQEVKLCTYFVVCEWRW